MAGGEEGGGGGGQPTFEESGETFKGGEIFESDGGAAGVPAAGVPAWAPAGPAEATAGVPAPASSGLAEGTKIDQVPLLDRETAELLAGTTKFMIQQDLKWMEAVTAGCVEQKNAYSVIDPDTNKRIMVVKEESDDCARCFCKPGHSLLLNFHRTRDDGKNVGDHVMTMEREGCCSKWGLGCWALYPDCQDGMVLHAGRVVGTPGQIGKEQSIAHAQVPPGGGGLHPTVQIMDRGVTEIAEPYAMIRGPTLFGGCLELCTSPEFGVAKIPNEWKKGAYETLHVGDIATITKARPKTFGGVLREMLTDTDTYTLEFKDRSMTPQQKAAMLGSLFLIDYMFFERDIDMCGTDSNGNCYINFCNCYCYGCLCPFKVVLSSG